MEYNKQYVIIYNDLTTSINRIGEKSVDIKENAFETDSIDEYNAMLKLVQVTTDKYPIYGFDIKHKKLIYPKKISTLERYSILEHYLGDDKTINDFELKKDRGVEFCASWRYWDYLKDMWGKKKHNKKLSNIQIEDDPYMTKFELDCNKKDERRKLEIYDD